VGAKLRDEVIALRSIIEMATLAARSVEQVRRIRASRNLSQAAAAGHDTSVEDAPV